jgi:hypothetical protein
MNNSFRVSLILAIIFGIAIALADTSTGWDDTGVSVFMILLSSAIFSYFGNQKPWLFALMVGLWLPILNIALSSNFESLAALIPAFLGAYGGRLVRKSVLEKF